MEAQEDPDSSDRIKDLFNIRYPSANSRLGGGSYGNVYPAVYRDASVAFKEFRNGVAEEEIRREVRVMKIMKGEYHIVQFVGRFVKEGRECILMEMAYNLSLKDVIEMELSRSLRIRIARDVCQAVRSLHLKGIAHEDIKVDNVLLDFGLRAKLCDFGHSRDFQEPNFSEKTGTRAYNAPERKIGREYDRMKSDIFSLGKVLQEILGEEGKSVVSLCLQDDPTKRPDCAEILRVLPTLPVSYADFRGLSYDLGEADRINIAYYWTDFDPDSEDADITRGRKLFYQESYSKAMEIFSRSEDAIAEVFLGIMKFHGYGCERDAGAASNIFEKCHDKEEFEGKSLLISLILYYWSVANLECDSNCRDSALKDLMQLASRGNSLAQMRLSSIHSNSHLTSDNLYGTHKRSHLRFLFSAAKAGYSHAQALLSLCHIYAAHKKTLPRKDREYLVRSVEGGSVLGKVLLDFLDDAVDEVEVVQSRNMALFEILGNLHWVTTGSESAKRWFQEAASGTSSNAALMMALILKRDGDLEASKGWLLKAQELEKERGHSLLKQENQYWCVNYSISSFITWEYTLAEIYWEEGKYDQAASIIRNSSDDSWAAALSLSTAFSIYADNPIWQRAVRDRRSSMALDKVFMIASWHQDEETGQAVEWFEEAARRGDGRAMNALGCMYLGQQDVAKARSLFEEAASKGDPKGLMNLGVMKREQERDMESAIQYFQQAASQRDPEAMAELADALMGVSDDHGRIAMSLLEQAVELGYDDCAIGLHVLHFKLENHAEAHYWFQRALRSIDFLAMMKLGIGYEDMDTADLVSELASTKSLRGLHLMGLYLIYKGEDERAYQDYLGKAAEQGHRQSLLCCLRLCLDQGDTEGAAKWRSLDIQRGYSGEDV